MRIFLSKANINICKYIGFKKQIPANGVPEFALKYQ